MDLDKKYQQRIKIQIKLVKYNPETKKEEYLDGKTINIHNAEKWDLPYIHKIIRGILVKKLK